jgi:hypothetical protein
MFSMWRAGRLKFNLYTKCVPDDHLLRSLLDVFQVPNWTDSEISHWYTGVTSPRCKGEKRWEKQDEIRYKEAPGW